VTPGGYKVFQSYAVICQSFFAQFLLKNMAIAAYNKPSRTVIAGVQTKIASMTFFRINVQIIFSFVHFPNG
jgi:hypothetical protein